MPKLNVSIEEVIKRLSKVENLDSALIEFRNELLAMYDNSGKTTSSKVSFGNQYKNIKSLLKDISKNRPILGLCSFQDYAGYKYQMFTNSYSLIGLKNYIEFENKIDGREVEYPSLNRIIEGAFKNEERSFKIDYVEISNALKKAKLQENSKIKEKYFIQLGIDKNTCIYVDVDLLLKTMKCCLLEETILKGGNNNKISPLGSNENENGNIFVILPYNLKNCLEGKNIIKVIEERV